MLKSGMTELKALLKESKLKCMIDKETAEYFHSHPEFALWQNKYGPESWSTRESIKEAKTGLNSTFSPSRCILMSQKKAFSTQDEKVSQNEYLALREQAIKDLNTTRGSWNTQNKSPLNSIKQRFCETKWKLTKGMDLSYEKMNHQNYSVWNLIEAKSE